MFRQPEEGVCLVCFCRYIAANYYFQSETKGDVYLSSED